MTTDEFELFFERGVTDGLPVVPPTRSRVERMLEATRRPPDTLLGEMPPNYGRVTVEKVAINAVMAGCRPDYLPVALAAAECACEPAFNLHGVATSTHFSAPLIVVNGPVRTRIGINSGFGVFGPGYRANATIGRALRLLMINVGGARPGETSMSTFGHPGRYTYCIAEHEEASPWPPYHLERGLAPGTADDGWTKADLRRFLHETIRRPYGELVPDETHGEGTNLRFARTPPAPDTLVSKFPSPDEVHVVVAGGTAGRFSMAIPGWLGTKNGSQPVTRRVEDD